MKNERPNIFRLRQFLRNPELSRECSQTQKTSRIMKKKSVLENDWNKIRRILKKSGEEKKNADGTTRSLENPEERELRAYFGNAKFEKLRDFAAVGDETRKKLGNVILLPGIMGSSLVAIDADGDEDTVWLSLRSLAFGRLKRLELNPDGKTNKNGENIQAPKVFGGLFRGFMFDYYSLALEALQAEHFSYDWRLDIRTSADRLAQFIQEKYSDGEKVSLVAHSMGGLVSRSFIRRHPALWDKIGGKLVMVGTPNHGAFDAVQALLGQNQTIRKLERFDIWNNLDELMSVFHSFPGLYQLLPAKKFNDGVYLQSNWSNFPSVRFDSHLADVEKFHDELAMGKIDAARMFYIAGTGFKTVDGIKSIRNGEFEFEPSISDGDGTVSHRLGMLDGVTTFFDTENEHSELLNGDKVLEAVRDLIETGKSALPTVKPEVARTRSISTTNDKEEQYIEEIVAAVRSGEMLAPEEVADVERKIQRAVWGGSKHETVKTDKTKLPVVAQPIELNLLQRDISVYANGDEEIIVVGKYTDLAPRGACAAIDKKLDYRLSLAHSNKIIGAELGQLFFVPPLISSESEGMPPQTVMLAGAGSYGKFRREDLRYLVMNAALAVLALGKNRFGIVLIGTGLNDFSVDRALRSILSGIADALARFPRNQAEIKEMLSRSKKAKSAAPPPEMIVSIYENNPVRFDEIKKVAETLAVKESESAESRENITHPIENVNLIFAEENIKYLTDERRLLEEKVSGERKQKNETIIFEDFVSSEEERAVTRITVKREPEKQTFLLSALTPTAALPSREISIQNCIVDSLIKKIRRFPNPATQQNYGRLLHSLLIPEDFQTLIDTNKPLVMLLDKSSAAVPWEMICYGGSQGFSTFGVELRLSRQFTLEGAKVASVVPPFNEDLKILVIADPADGDLSLPGARLEGERLKKFFEEFKPTGNGKITVDSCIGKQECDIVEVLAKIFTEEYDIIHFSGHGYYDPKENDNSGWVFGTRKVIAIENGVEKETEKLLVISPREIFRLRKVPRLIFANACFSSQTAEMEYTPAGKTYFPESGEKLAGIAEAFFARGVQNYIGAGWQVNDSLAVTFAETFYQTAFSLNAEKKYNNLGEALKIARETIKNKINNATWGAYQHYGDSNTRLLRKPK
jgi:pimeloyl-ACP methyl ester carboxylesterase